jgi:hypothetical protein
MTAGLRAQDSGVYRAPGELDALRAALEEAGGRWLEADLAGVADKTALLDRLARACAFPSTFGQNWDALADILQDGACFPRAAYVLHLRNAGAAGAALASGWSILLEILTQSAMFWKDRGKAFVVLIEGVADLAKWP